ncbi:MAG: ParB/RepB/Spo0J family partition protein [Elusimicrobia bacterium]|nr:ParB/RepB/Spo0J family partition protein [Elusimicrobiota bacterium]
MRQALGRGLAALIPAAEPEQTGQAKDIQAPGPVKVPIDKIRANRFQPRKNFDQDKLAELAETIKEHGLSQPIIVSRDEQNGGYELIAGERRLRACQLAGFVEIEAIVRTGYTDKQRLAVSLVENLQRENLNAIEAALGYLRLMKEFQISQTELTKVVGKAKSSISNTLRLLELPDNIQKAIHDGQISEGHARAILMVDDDSKKQALLNKIIEDGLSVRDAEDLARVVCGIAKEAADKRKRHTKQAKSADIRDIESALQHHIGTKVEIRTKKDSSKGVITLHFYSLTDFDKLINILKK